MNSFDVEQLLVKPILPVSDLNQAIFGNLVPMCQVDCVIILIKNLLLHHKSSDYQIWHGHSWPMGVDCQPRLGFHAAAVDVSEPQAIVTEALRLAKATPQECGVLSTKHLQGAFPFFGKEDVGPC